MRVFRDSFVIETRMSVDDLISRLQQSLSHPRGWADRLFPATNRPDGGEADEHGFFLVWRYFKMSIRFRGEVAPREDGQSGSRVSVRMYSLGWTELILYACLFVPAALPVLPCIGLPVRRRAVFSENIQAHAKVSCQDYPDGLTKLPTAAREGPASRVAQMVAEVSR